MSIIISIFQAIFQSIGWILPISESGHSAIYHDFAGRADGSVSVVTGVIHIGIAVGIILAMLKMFIMLTKQFAFCTVDLAKRNFSYKEAKPSRKFMLMTLISFVPMLLWLIPIGKYGFLFKVLKSTAYNNTLLDEGIFLAVIGVLVFFAARQLALSKNDKNVTVLTAVVIGAVSVFLVPVSGLSLIGGIFSVLMLFGVSKKLAFRYGFVVSVPVLIVMGIIEICTASYKAGVVSIIIALVISVIVSFLCVRLFKWIIDKGYLKYISIYDMAIGVIVAIIGIVQLIVRN